jgi:hypothetical protein
MRSSPQVTFSLTIRAISCRISCGSCGRRPRDFQRQYHLKPLRCQRRKVFVFTTTSAACQSNKRDQNNRHNGRRRGVGVVGSDGLGSRRAAFARTRSRRPKPPASVKSWSRTGGCPGAIPTEWRKRNKDYAKRVRWDENMPIQLRTDTSAPEHNSKKILAICTEPRAFRRLHEVFADHRRQLLAWKCFFHG